LVRYKKKLCTHTYTTKIKTHVLLILIKPCRVF